MRRRQLLAALGIGGAALAVGPFRRLGRADEPVVPKRLVLFYTRHGTEHPSWQLRPPGAREDADWELALGPLDDPGLFSEILRPLHGVRHELLVLDGLALVTALADRILGEHETGQVHSLTGAAGIRLSDDRLTASAPSIDQIVAGAIRRPDRLPSLELGLYGGLSVSYAGAETQLPLETSPAALFDRLFPGGDAAGEGRSVLDLVQGEYEAMLPRVDREARAELELHRDLVRDLERRLDALDRDLGGVACAAPARPEDVPFGVPGAYARTCEAMTDLTAAALACDLTRVVSLQMQQMPNEACGAPAGDIHADYAHRVRLDPAAAGVMTAYHRTHAAQLRALVERLGAIETADGSLLDHTAIVWCGELATGDHLFHPWPVVVAGGRRLGLSTGRYLHYAARTPTPSRDPDGPARIGIPHNRFWVAMARRFGLDVDAVGTRALTAADGTPLDLTGPLF